MRAATTTRSWRTTRTGRVAGRRGRPAARGRHAPDRALMAQSLRSADRWGGGGMAICEVTVVRTDDRALVTLLGEADIAYRDELGSSLSEVVAARPGVIEVDLGGLEFIDST